MDLQNIFDQDVNYLIKIRDEVKQCDLLEAEKKQLQDKCDKMKKAISQEEKSINDEINSTVKKRRAEIEKSYDDQLDEGRKKVKKAQNKKEKEKSERVGQRVDEETSDVRAHSRDLKAEMKSLFKRENVPGFCRTGLYYSLFMPKGIKEIAVLLLSMVIGLGGIPFGVYLLLSKVVFVGKIIGKGTTPFAETSVFMAVVVGLSIIIVLGIYFAVFNLTKVKHRDVIAEGREIRNQLYANDKDIRKIKKAISKDKDESQYELGAFDEKISEYQNEVDVIEKKKKAALKEFDQDTKETITNEINGRRLGKLEEMKEQKASIEEDKNDVETRFKEASLEITDHYVKYLGKNICKVETLNDIINIMETEGVGTISEAISIYKGETPHKNQAT